VTRTLLGLGLIAFCWIAIGYSIYQLLQVGTCASGGPYAIARECPPGIERLMLSLAGAIVLLLVGAVIYAGRGSPPGSSRPPRTGLTIVFVWTGIFWSLAVGCLLGIYGPDAEPGPGGALGGWIVAGMGIVFGAGGLLALRAAPDPSKVRPLVARAAGTASRFSAAADPVDRLATLDRLRRQGVLTDAEFETLKARIVGEGRS
jgi:Short C-terminal domain